MSVIIIDTLGRGGSGTSPFPVILEQDSSISYVTVADVTTRDAIPEWKRRSNMQCFVISTGLAYRLGTDLTIGGQVWTEIPGVGSGFQLLSEKGQVDGYVPLDSLGKIDAAYINNIYSNNSYTAASEAAMLALTTQTGDIITRTDSSQIFVKLNNNGPPAVIGDFAELLFPGSVLSVNGLTGAVSITFTSLLAWASNQTEFDAAVTANTTVSGNSGAITINQTDISTLQAEVLVLQNATKQITDFDSGIDYVVTVDYVVFPEATSGILELFKCIQSTSAPSPDPTNPAYWERIGDYLTTTEIAALLDLKADLVAGIVPLTQLPPEVFSGTVIVADIAFRDAYTPKNVGLVFYVKDASADPEVTTGAAEYIYDPGDPLADGEGFVLKENPTTDDVDEGSTNLYYTEARVTANSSVAANTTHKDSDGKDHSDVVANNAKVSADESIDTHSDVDISTVTPAIGQSLIWDGADFVPYTPQETLPEPNTWYVNTNGNDITGNGSSEKPFATLQKAHDAAESNDTIIIQDITYSSSSAVSITKNITIKGPVSYVSSQWTRLTGTWTMAVSGRTIIFENLSVGVDFVATADFTIDCSNSNVDIASSSSRYMRLNIRNCNAFLNNTTGIERFFSWNCNIISDNNLNIGSRADIYNSSLIGNIITGQDTSWHLKLYDSYIEGNATVTGDLEKNNSVITGTETVSGTTTIESQLRKRKTPSIAADVLDIDFQDDIDYKTIAEVAATVDFEITVSNATNADIATIDLFITNTVIITLPSGSLMEDSETRWVGTPTFELTIEGGTGESFELSLNKVGSKYKWVMSQKFV